MAFLILVGIFIGAIVVSNIIAVKIINISGIIISVGSIVYPITFLVTDVINEIWGKRIATQVVLAGFVASLFTVMVIQISIFAPPAVFWEEQQSYVTIFRSVPRVVAASMVTYLIVQTHDVYAFHFWKVKTKGKMLWLRNNASTFVSQTLDSALFTTLAFWGTVPNLFQMIIGGIVVKIIIAIADTPFCYLGVGLIRKLTNVSKYRIERQSANLVDK